MVATVEVRYPGGKRVTFEVESGLSIEDALREQGITPESVVTLRDNVPVPITTKLKDGDQIVAIIAFSGG